MSEPKRYVISSVADFMSVPVEKIDECLADFDIWLGLQWQARALGETLGVKISLTNSAPDECGPDRFVWIDDGKHVATITMREPDGTISSRELDFGSGL